jgi:protein gp37
MTDRTAIQWTDATVNPWWGCERVSPACAHCCADTLARRYGHFLGDGESPRRFLTENHLAAADPMERTSVERGEPIKVFCASMADVFEDRPELAPWRERPWTLIQSTQMLQWQSC